MNRFELKYLIHWNDHLKFAKDIAPFCRTDKYGDEYGAYPLVSLYYDTDDYMFYNEKIQGYDCRNKLRLRAYGKGTGTCFIEIKQKHNLNIFKWRVRMPLEEAYKYLQNPNYGEVCLKYGDKEADSLNRIAFLVDLYKVKPKIVISYSRKALTGIYDNDLRITFDTNLKYRNFDLRVEAGTHGKYFMPPYIVVLEIKVKDYVPEWLSKVVSRHEFSIQRVSKYCLGVQSQFSMRTL